jgi:hypothetical protein
MLTASRKQGRRGLHMNKRIRIGDENVSVLVDGSVFTGTVYDVRENGWACVETYSGHVASGPVVLSEQPC